MLTTVFKVPQALSVAPSLCSGRYNRGHSETLNTVVPSEAATNYYLFTSQEVSMKCIHSKLNILIGQFERATVVLVVTRFLQPGV